MSEEVIRVSHLNKMYKLYDRQRDRLRDSLGLTRKKLYHEHYALKDVSLSINKGETVGIIGTNGSGKSTILKIITGVLSPTDGEVSIDDVTKLIDFLLGGDNGACLVCGDVETDGKISIADVTALINHLLRGSW